MVGLWSTVSPHNQYMTDDRQGDVDGLEEELAASVVAGRDPPSVLLTGEEVFDPVSLRVVPWIVRGWNFPAAARRDAGCVALVVKGFAEEAPAHVSIPLPPRRSGRPSTSPTAPMAAGPGARWPT